MVEAKRGGRANRYQRNARPARRVPTRRHTNDSLTRPYDYRADLRDELVGLAGTVFAWIMFAALGALLAWCLMFPDYHPITKAEWEAQLAAQGVAE